MFEALHPAHSVGGGSGASLGKMEFLGGLDALFLACETPNTHMHVCGVLVLDTSTMPEGDPYEHIRALLVDRIPSVPAMHQVLTSSPFGLTRPFWVEVPQVDIDHHLHRAHLKTSEDTALADLVGEIASQQLRRDRPLWEIWVVDGLGKNRVAMIAKMHHATIDGVSGANLMGSLFDLTPEVTYTNSRESKPAMRPPGRVGALPSILRDSLLEPVKVMKLIPTTAIRLGASAHKLLTQRDEFRDAAIPFSAPRVSFNSVISARRSVAFTSVPLHEVKRVKAAFGVTVNDLLTAIVGGGLRSYLELHEDLPLASLIAAEPVSAHEQAEKIRGTTKVSLMFSTLRTDIVDPVKRLEAVARANHAGKAFRKVVGDDLMLEWAEHLWGPVVAAGMKLYSGLGIANYLPVAHNLILSNIAAPPIPLYLAGARLVGVYPFGPIMDGAGMNVTVFSGEETVGFGVVVCPELVPDVWEVVSSFPAALAELSALAPAG